MIRKRGLVPTKKYRKETPRVVTFISNKQKSHFFLYKFIEEEDRTGSVQGVGA
jgi:hypothetical protein